MSDGKGRSNIIKYLKNYQIMVKAKDSSLFMNLVSNVNVLANIFLYK